MEAVLGWLLFIAALLMLGLLLTLPLRLVMALFGRRSNSLRWTIHFVAAIVVAGGLWLSIPVIVQRWLSSGLH